MKSIFQRSKKSCRKDNDNSENTKSIDTLPPPYLDGLYYQQIESKNNHLLNFFDHNNNNSNYQLSVKSSSQSSLLKQHATAPTNPNVYDSGTGSSLQPAATAPHGTSTGRKLSSNPMTLTGITQSHHNSIPINKSNREKFILMDPKLSELNFTNHHKLVTFGVTEKNANQNNINQLETLSLSSNSQANFSSHSNLFSHQNIHDINTNSNNEWLAYNTIFIFQNTRSLWKIVQILIPQEEHSKVMNAPTHPDKRMDENYKIDDTIYFKETQFNSGRKIKCSAPEYINFTFNEILGLISDTNEFPTKHDNPFKNDFVESTIKKILRLLINVLSHMYTRKIFMRLQEHGIHTRLNRVFAHITLLIRYADLSDVLDFKNHCLCDLIAVLTEK